MRATGARIDHRYELYRGEELVAEGETTLACVDRTGRLQRIPEMLRTTDF
jgi:acyl-CoA thioester hydrolase